MFEQRALALDNLPTRLTIETTAICNLRCVMCPHSIDAVQRPNHMPLEILERLVEPMANAERAQLHGIGEPLASPALWRAIENNYFSADAALTINTNLTLLNARRLKKLMEIEAKLTLNVSLDAATPRTYRRIRGGEMEEVLANIRRLLAERRDADHPAIWINMTLMRENIGEAPAFVELGKALGVDAVCFWHLNRLSDSEMARYSVERDGWRFEYVEQGLWNHPALSDQMLRQALERARELDMNVWFDESKNTFFDAEDVAPVAPAARETVKDCPLPWDSFMTTSDGVARICCYSKPIGNLNDDDFQGLWNGALMQEVRSESARDRIHWVCRGAACKYVGNMPEPVAAPWAGDEISLTAAAGDHERAFVSGCHDAEDWGRWSNGEQAEIVVNIADTPTPAKRLLLNITALVTREPQRIAVAINGVERRAVDLAGSGDIVIVCALPDRLSGPTKIVVSTSYACSPKDWGADDQRSLGVGLRSLALEFSGDETPS